MDTEYKIKFIYENIDFINNHKEIYNFIIMNNIKYSENNNGLFVNISILSDEVIHNLFFLVNNIINNKEEENLQIQNEIYSVKNISEPVNIKKNINDIFLKDFTNEEKNLIKLSKTYKFE